MTSQRIGDQSVAHAVHGVAGGNRCGVQGWHVGGVQDGILQVRNRRTGQPSVMETILDQEIHCRSASRNSVKIFRESLSFHKPFAPAVRATREIRITGLLTIELCDQGLCHERRGMHATIGKIDAQLLIQRPPRAAHSLMAHVSGS